MLREQVITPRAGRGVAREKRGHAGSAAQRPATRRGGAARANARGAAWRTTVAWMPAIGKALLAVCAGMLAFNVYHAASASPFFTLRTVDIRGAGHASADQLEALTRRAVGAQGVWRADLDAIRAELERQPWVRGATVARVLPSGLRVRITERVPRAVVRPSVGRLTWVDDDGIFAGTVTPADQMPAFFLRGLDET